MKNARKYISLWEREERQNKKAEYYSIGLNYNPERRDNWQDKVLKTNQEMYQLESTLTTEEKEYINEYYNVEIFNDKEL